MQVTVFLNRSESPTKVTFPGDYDWELTDGNFLAFFSEIEGESDYVFNYDQVLYFEERPQ
jgi:hypothetical protein